MTEQVQAAASKVDSTKVKEKKKLRFVQKLAMHFDSASSSDCELAHSAGGGRRKTQHKTMRKHTKQQMFESNFVTFSMFVDDVPDRSMK